MALQPQNGYRAGCAIADRSMPPQPRTIDRRVHGQIEALIPRLTRYARSLTHDPAAADDLVQESVSRGLEKIHLWHAGTDLRAWLFTIMHHHYVDEVRRAARENKVPLGECDRPLEPQQGLRLEFRDLVRAIDALPSEQRSAIMLVAVDEMRYDEAASALGLPLGTVRSRVSRGRDTLRRLTDRLPSDGGAGPANPQATSRNPRSSHVERMEKRLRRGQPRVGRLRATPVPKAPHPGASAPEGGREAVTRRSEKLAG
jgi:RNA polymerase sigma-70 factor, ECF subfamily